MLLVSLCYTIFDNLTLHLVSVFKSSTFHHFKFSLNNDKKLSF